jgi:uroporphyrinogen decarboxylase
MEDMIEAGIDAKHSNEDVIAPFDTWIERYGDRIGLLGGVDVDILCREDPEAIFERVVAMGKRFRAQAKGYALGSGNSIPDYVPVEGYLAMIRAAQALREMETA